MALVIKKTILVLNCLVLCLFWSGTGFSASEEPLKVIGVFPSGDTPMVKQFTVTFNQQMVNLGDLKADPDMVPLEITPQMEGQYRWLNIYTLIFEPKTPLEGSLTGQIRVKAGAEAVSGARLEQDKVVSYSLPRVRLDRVNPRENKSGLPLKPKFLLSFNQPIDQKDLEAKAYFTTQSGSQIGIRVLDTEEVNTRRKIGQSWKIRVMPQKDLEPDAAFHLVVPAGLKSTVGPLLSPKDIKLSYRTYGPLQVKDVTGYRPAKNDLLDPESGLRISFTNPVPVKGIGKHIKVYPEYDFSRIGDDEFTEEETTVLWLPGPMEPNTEYRFSFQPGLKDIYGQSIRGKINFKVKLGPTRPVLDLPGNQGVIEMSDNPTYPFQVRNIDRVDLRGVLLKPEEAIPFIMGREMYGYISNSSQDFLYGFPQDRIKSQAIEIKNPENVMTWEPVDFKALFGATPGSGLIYFDLHSRTTDALNKGKTLYHRALVQVTDIGLSAKFGQDNTLVWTTDLAAGKPLAGAEIEIRNKSNQVLWQGRTDDQGLALAPGAAELLPRNQERAWGKPSFFVLARHNGRFSLISNQWDSGISPWNFSLSARELEEGPEVLTYVLTALPLYKPGDTVDFKIIQRKCVPAGLSLSEPGRMQARIDDSWGREVQSFDLELSQFGTASAQLVLPADAHLGLYDVRVGPKGGELRYAGYFRVETYRKPSFTVDVTPSAKTGIVGDRVRVDVKADYHFGSPVKEQPVNYYVMASPADFRLPRFDDFNIRDYHSDPDDEYEPTPVISQGSLTLDDDGRAQWSFEAAAPSKPMPRDFTLEATVTDVDQRTVSQRNNILIHPASIYVGLKTDRYLVPSSDKIGLDLIAATPEGELLSGIDTDLVLYRRVWHTVRRKGVGGYYRYVSKPTDTVIDKLQTKSEDQPRRLEFDVAEPGFYFIAAGATDDKGRHAASSAGFYVYGSGSAGWEYYDHDRIDLVLDKEAYAPGETAALMVKSPFTSGSGLLTVERDGVRRYELFEINGSTPALKIDLSPEDGPNVYVSVLLVRGRISDKLDRQGRDPGKPAFKVGYAEIKVNDNSRALQVAVTPDRVKARPGEEMEISVKVTDSNGDPKQAEVALIVADAALLQLASDKVYYPDNFFFAPRPLGVWTADLRLNLIGRRHYGLKGAEPGGGGMGPDGENFRKKFVSLALFKPHLVTDESGRASVTFTLPDNLTTFKIFAVTNDDRQGFGTGVNEFTITKPLLVKSALPRFAGVSDRMRAAVAVHNRTQTSGTAVVTLSGEGFTPLEESRQSFELAAGAGKEIGFPVRVEPGVQAVFRFTVSMGDDKDAAEFRIPVNYPNHLRTAGTYGRLIESVQVRTMLPEGSDPERGGLTLSLSPSLVGSLGGTFDYLAQYPYECLEQKTSRTFGYFFQVLWRERLGLDEEALTKARHKVTAFLEEAGNVQDYQGGFAYWPDSGSADPYLSAYVVQFMTFAKNAGFKVDMEKFERAHQYLTGVLGHDRWPFWYSAEERNAARAYLVNVLAEAGLSMEPELEQLYRQRKRMSSFELALLLKTLKLSDPKAKSDRTRAVSELLFNRAVITSGELYFEDANRLGGLMGSQVRTNAFALRALIGISADTSYTIPLARWLINQRGEDHWGNTQSNALMLVALSEYIKVMEAQTPDFTIKALLDGDPVAEAVFNSFSDAVKETVVSARKLEPGVAKTLNLEYQGQGTGYYTLRLQFAPAEPDLSADQAGFVVDRTYTKVNPDGTTAVGPPFKRGDLVKIDVTLLVPSARHWVVLEDRLPAGLEPINFGLPVAPQSVRILLDQGQRPLDYFNKYWYNHQEIHSDRVAVFARYLPEGAFTFSYMARAVTPGLFIAPGSKVEEMYSPETSGRGQGLNFEIME